MATEFDFCEDDMD